MSEIRALLERKRNELHAPPESFERLVRRRDRKRRNQRIAAGVVGIAVFVAAMWIVTSVGSVDRTRGPAGEGTTGPAETVRGTGPDGTGPRSTGRSLEWLDVEGPALNVGSDELPLEGASPSQPQHGELVTSDWAFKPGPKFVVTVYADGRMIWFRESAGDRGTWYSPWIEQRLTPEGVELLRSGAVPLGGQYVNPGERLPASAWEDATLRPYVPSTYAVCWQPAEASPSGVLRNLPSRAASRLQGTQRVFHEVGRGELLCFEVSIESARMLAQTLIDEGWYHAGVGPWTWFANTPGLPSLVLEFNPVLPDGAIHTRG
jgi:hypothetical protein